jgi:Leucine Rich Repeat
MKTLSSFLSFLLLIGVGERVCALNAAEMASLAQLQEAWHLWTGEPSCDWHGIECSSGEHVTSIELFNSGVSGPIPDCFAGLKMLQQVILSFNSLIDSLPPSLLQLPYLNTLLLNSNQLNGTIPDDIALPAMSQLNLSGNQLTGTLPQSLSMMPNITIIEINDNQLSGRIPQDWSRATKLGTLDLRTNRLSGPIPPFLGRDQPDLDEVDFGENQLTGPVPASLFKPHG